MDTAEAAKRLGTTPRQLRQFLRSRHSTFVAVGSGARYEFTEQDIPTLERRFGEWRSGGKKAGTPKPAKTKSAATLLPAPTRRAPTKRDLETWSEEGPVKIDDLRNPRVRDRVQRNARAAEDRLMMLLISKGLHISQLGDRRTS
jgi:DNA-binding transcriptional MerR regulator